MRRPRFFSAYEWWYHLAMMPVLFPLGNYFFIGPSYFQNLNRFVAGTLVVFFLYWVSIITLTLAIRQIIIRFPDVRQTRRRLLTMLVVVGLLTTILALFDVGVYSLVPATGVRFSWETVRSIWVLGAVFDILLCTALGLFYTFEQWQLNQTETERLQRMALQHQFDSLKGQVNPHFLFNSLSSLSSLIGEDNAQAERFVDYLARVYRYMLQAADRNVVSLQAELDFVQTYAYLLRVRYGASIRIELQSAAVFADYGLPPLSLQILVDNAIKHNIMLPEQPLTITIQPASGPAIRIDNTLQRKNRLVDMAPSSLSSLMSKYELLTEQEVRVQETDATFSVTLPLLPPSVF